MINNFTNLFQAEIVVFLFLSGESGLVKQFLPNVSKSVVDWEQDDLHEKTKKDKEETTNHQSPQNVGILGSRIPRKVLESEEG